MNEIGKLVSIVIPVYNTDKYLEKCITSVINQTYHNIEIILVNDGSTDSSGSICDSFAAQDTRIVHVNKVNGGLSDARNVGIEMAKGDYITFIDSDDFVSEYYIESLYKALIQYDSDISMANYVTYYSDDCKSIGNEYACDFEGVIFSGLDALVHYFDYRIHANFVVSWDKMYRKSLFDDVRFPIGRINEDTFTTYKLYYKASKVVYINEQLYYYVQREGSIMNSGFSLKRFDLVEADRELWKFCTERGVCIPNATKKLLYDYWCFVYEYRKCRIKNIASEIDFEKDFIEEYRKKRIFLSRSDRLKMDVYSRFPRVYWCYTKSKQRLRSIFCER